MPARVSRRWRRGASDTLDAGSREVSDRSRRRHGHDFRDGAHGTTETRRLAARELKQFLAVRELQHVASARHHVAIRAVIGSRAACRWSRESTACLCTIEEAVGACTNGRSRKEVVKKRQRGEKGEKQKEKEKKKKSGCAYE